MYIIRHAIEYIKRHPRKCIVSAIIVIIVLSGYVDQWRLKLSAWRGSSRVMVHRLIGNPDYFGTPIGQWAVKSYPYNDAELIEIYGVCCGLMSPLIGPLRFGVYYKDDKVCGTMIRGT